MSRMQGFALPADVSAIVAKSRARTAALRAQLGAEDRPWYRISNAADDEAELLLYDEIGGYFGTYAEDFDAELKAITAPKLTVRVNSPGGSVTEGIAIASALRAHPAEITVRVDGIAASIASVIAMAGDRVAMMPGSMIMVHEASGLCLGDSRDMVKMGQVLDVISENIAEMYAAKSGAPAGEWRAKMLEETWLRAEEAVEQGLADEIVQPKQKPQQGDEPEMRQQFDLTAYGYQGPRREEPKAEPTLTEDIRSLIGEEIAAQLAAAVAPPVENANPVEPVAETTPVELAPEPAAVPELEAPAAEPVDEWAAMVAHLTQDEPDPWAALVNHLTSTTASSSAATEAA